MEEKGGLKKGWEEKGDFVFSPLLLQDGKRSTKRKESSTRPKDQFPSLSSSRFLIKVEFRNRSPSANF